MNKVLWIGMIPLAVLGGSLLACNFDRDMKLRNKLLTFVIGFIVIEIILVMSTLYLK